MFFSHIGGIFWFVAVVFVVIVVFVVAVAAAVVPDFVLEAVVDDEDAALLPLENLKQKNPIKL